MSKNKSSGASRLTDLSEGRQDVAQIDPRTIVVQEGFNYRNFKTPENKQHLKDTKASIRQNGILNPLWVRWDAEHKVPVLVAGETRLRSVLEILSDETEDDAVREKVKTIPVIQKTGSNHQILLLSLQENTQKNPSQWEAGQGFKRLMEDDPETGEKGMTVEEIATAMGLSKKYISDSLLLENAPPEIQALLSQMAVSPAHAVGTIKKYGGQAKYVLETQVKKAREIVDKKAKAKAEKAAADKAAGKKNKGGRPVKADKPVKVTVKREKKTGGRFVKDDVLKLVTKALTVASKSEDPDVSMTASSALEALKAKSAEE